MYVLTSEIMQKWAADPPTWLWAYIEPKAASTVMAAPNEPTKTMRRPGDS